MIKELKQVSLQKTKWRLLMITLNFLTQIPDGSVIVQSISTPLSNEAFMASSSIKGDKTPLALKVEQKTN